MAETDLLSAVIKISVVCVVFAGLYWGFFLMTMISDFKGALEIIVIASLGIGLVCLIGGPAYKNIEVKAITTHSERRAELQRSIDAGNVDNDLLLDCATENEWLMDSKRLRQARKAGSGDLSYMDGLVNATPIMYQGAVVTYDTVPAKPIAGATSAQ